MADYGYCILLFNLLIFSDFTPAYGKPRFGCNFDDEYNLLDEIPNDGSISKEPIWTTGNKQKASFKDVPEFKEFLKALNIVNDKVQSSNNYNTLDNVMAFWVDYGREGIDRGYSIAQKYLYKFFQSYKERKTPNDGAFFAIELTNQFMKEYPKFADKMHSVYLSSCNMDDDAIAKLSSLFQSNQLDENPSKLPIEYFHDHILSFMEFQIGDDGKKSGTIVMDCGLSINDIIVLMDGEDVDKLSHARSWGSGRILSGAEHLYERVGAYVRVSSIKSSRNKNVVHQMCYVKKGICSFEEHTRKRTLTRPDHYLLAHDDNGDVKGGMSVNLYDPVDTEVNVKVVFWHRATAEKSDLVHLYIPFKKLWDFYDEINKAYSKSKNTLAVNKVARILGISDGLIRDYIYTIAKMIEDAMFMDQLHKLHIWFKEGFQSSVDKPDYSHTRDVSYNKKTTIAPEFLQKLSKKFNAFGQVLGINSGRKSRL